MKCVKECFIIFFVSAFSCIKAEVYSNMLYLQGRDEKCTSTGYVVTTYSVRSSIQCSVVCAANDNCGGMNYYIDGFCELLPYTARIKNACQLVTVSQPGWMFYSKKVIEANFDSSSNAVCMPFDPLNIVLPDVSQMVICTTSPYIVNQWNAGKHDCRFKRVDNTEFGGYDISNIQTASLDISFLAAMKSCMGINCASVVCISSSCWWKYTNHIMNNASPNVTNKLGYTYWFASCV